MSPDDERHGTNGGYLQHVFAKESACEPCRDAHNTYRRNLWRKKYLRRVDQLYIDSTGTIRRIRALMALGWRYSDIDEAAGQRTSWTHNLTNQKQVHLDTADRVARIYDELSMTPGPSNRLRALALKYGWHPPLAWDDATIDDPDEQPNLGGNTDDQIDHVIVDRLIAGERILSSPAEKVEAMRRWLAAGGSEREMCRVHGWKDGRYVEREDGAA